MKKLIFILFTLFVALGAYCQTKYPIPYDTVIVMKPNGVGYLKASKGIFYDTLFLSKFKFTDGNQQSGYVITSDANGNASWQAASGGGGTPAGNYGNIQLNRFGVFATPALDSFTIASNILKILHNVNLGVPISATAKLAIANSGTIPYIQSGPANVTHSNVAWYSLFSTDSIGFNNSTLKPLGIYALRSTIFATGSNLSLTFKFGHDLRWNPQVSDSIRFNPQNSDGISAARSTFYFTKAPGYTGRSVVSVGTNMADVSSAHLAMIELKGSSGSNNFRIRSNAATDPTIPSAGLGGLAGNTSDILSDNALADSVDQYYGFLSTKGGSVTPHINRMYDFFSSPGGSGSFVDSAWSYFSIKPQGYITRHFFGGPSSFDPTGLHTGPSEAVEIYGNLKLQNSSYGVGKIAFSDVNGIISFVDTTGLFPGTGGGGGGWPLTGTFALTGNVTGGLAGHTLVLGDASNYVHVSSDLFSTNITDGVTNSAISNDAEQAQMSSNNEAATAFNQIRVNQNGGLVTVATGKTFEGNLNFAASYTNYSFTQKRYVDSLFATGGSGTVTSVATGWGAVGGTITTTGTIRVDSNLVTSRLWHQKAIDSLGAVIGGKISGSLTSTRIPVASGASTLVDYSAFTFNSTGSVLQLNGTYFSQSGTRNTFWNYAGIPAGISGASDVLGIGYATVSALTSGSAIMAMGTNAGTACNTCSNFTFFSPGAGASVTNATEGVYIGTNAGGTANSSYSTLIGSKSNNGNILTTAIQNILIGYAIAPPSNQDGYISIGNAIFANGATGIGSTAAGKVGIVLNTPTSTLHVGGSFATAYVAKTTTYTATINDYTIDCTSGTFTVTLPTAASITGRIYVIKNSGTGVITIATTSSQTIDGVTTKTLSTQYSGYAVQSNGSNWLIIQAF